jgi:hypothetical protein
VWAAMLERMRRSDGVSSFTGADDSRAACAAGCESSGVQRVFVAKLRLVKSLGPGIIMKFGPCYCAGAGLVRGGAEQVDLLPHRT